MSRVASREELDGARVLRDAILHECEIRSARIRIGERGTRDADGILRGGLMDFVREFWHVLEPETEFVDGWPLWAIAEHLEAVSFGEITRLLINISPGSMKSLMVSVFWPAWEWGALGRPATRYVAFSYAATLTERDNGRFRALIMSEHYRDLWPHVELERYGDMKIANTSTGWKFASSIEGVGTGERGDRVILDDPHKVDMTESKVVRANTVRWFRTAMMNRLNDQARSAIVVIMQRIAEDDVSGAALEYEMGFTHLMIPMEYDSTRHCETSIGWSDPRSGEGELAWPDRFDTRVVSELKRDLGPVAYAAQYDQSPKPREGGIFKADWWRVWNPRDGRFPDCDLIVASLDGAFTEREENDPSALTIWGVWNEEARDTGEPDEGERDPPKRSIVLMHAFRKHLALSGERSRVERARGESLRDWRVRTQPYWGLLEWVLDVCAYRFRVHHLLIEARGPGISAAQELRNRWAHELGACGIVLIHPKGDKIARAQSVQPLFAQGCVYAPDRAWAQMVIDEMEVFPRGRHDDLTDSATQALRWLRDNGLAMTEREVQNERSAVRSRRPLEALYPC